jgi:hypothetical protein
VAAEGQVPVPVPEPPSVEEVETIVPEATLKVKVEAPLTPKPKRASKPKAAPKAEEKGPPK